jgi:hypothetical protein
MSRKGQLQTSPGARRYIRATEPRRGFLFGNSLE